MSTTAERSAASQCWCRWFPSMSNPSNNYQAYMLPVDYQFINALPVTIDVKVDDQKLLHMELSLTRPISATSTAETDQASKG